MMPAPICGVGLHPARWPPTLNSTPAEDMERAMAASRLTLTSARLLFEFAASHWGPQIQAQQPDLVTEKRYLLVHDLYIKARSYALLNKVAFWLALLLGIAVVIWPSLEVLGKALLDADNAVLSSAVVQTTVTGLAALTFALYSHYKKRQVCIENLMRQLIYTDLPQTAEADDEIVAKVLMELERIDAGFSFTEHLNKKEQNSS